jgi:ferredoxin
MIRFRTPDGAIHDSGLCETQLNVLAHAQAIELSIGSSCGGHGICGSDRIRVPESVRAAFSGVSDEERRHLSAGELAQGWRLGCQCFPDRADLDATLEVLSTG